MSLQQYKKQAQIQTVRDCVKIKTKQNDIANTKITYYRGDWVFETVRLHSAVDVDLVRRLRARDLPYVAR